MGYHPDKSNNNIDLPSHPNLMGMDNLLSHMDDTMNEVNDEMNVKKKSLKIETVAVV